MIQRYPGTGIPRGLRSLSFCGALTATWLLAGQALAAGGGKPVSKLLYVVDTRAMGPGFVRWVADVYNTNLWLFGLVVVVTMASMGVVLGFIFDKAMGLLGINLGKLDHHE